jgi:hypothetical protein
MTITQPMPPNSLEPEPQNPNIAKELSHKDKTKILAWVNENQQKAKSARQAQERQWYVNLAFYFGKQNVVPVLQQGVGHRLQTPKAPYWRARPVINKIRPTIRKELVKITSSKPTAFVVPASSEDEDLFAAQAAEQLWESIYDDKHMHSVLKRAAFWTCLTGTGFIKNWWEPSAVDEFNELSGDIKIQHETPYHIGVLDLREEDIENQPLVIHTQVKSLEWAKATYDEELAKNITATSRGEAVLDSGFLKLIGVTDQPKDSVEVFETWVKPGQFKQYPEGAMITIVGGQIVQFWEGWPYQHNMYPFAKLDHIPTGQFYGESIITDLIPLQKEYNRTHGQIIEAKNRMAKPQLLAAQGSINPAQITTEPGQVITYKLGFPPPSPLPLAALPSYVLEELDRIQADMNEISAQNEVSKGAVPPGVTAATAISYLQEQDDSMLSFTIESLEAGVQKVAKMCLNYVQQYWTAERMVKTTGADGSFDVIMLKGADLEGNTDIRIEKDSALPTSKAAKQAFIMDLMKMGFIDPNKGLEVMEIGGINKIYESLHVDVRQAQRENLRMQNIPDELIGQYIEAEAAFRANERVAMMSQGAVPPPVDPETGEPMGAPEPPIPVNSWDNHAVHIEVHDKFRKSQSFEALPDELKQVFEAHVQLHNMAMQDAMMQQMMQGGAMPGGAEGGTMSPEMPPPPQG